MSESNPLGLRWGFRSIGAFIGIDERRAQFLVKTGRLPAKKIGKNYVASESMLKEHLEGQLRACRPPGEAK